MKIKKKPAVLIIAAVLAVAALQIDDPLSDDANAMLNAIPWQSPSDAYLYLLGLDAPLGKDPIEEGKRALSKLRRVEALYGDFEAFEQHHIGQSAQTLQFPNPDPQVFCSSNEPECLRNVFSSKNVGLDQDVYIALKDRYLTFLKIKGFHSLTKPHIYETFPNYSALVKANRVVSLAAINQARDCCPQQAVDDLYALIELQKVHMAQADTLIGKLISYALFNETVDVLSMLLREFKIEGRKIELLIKKELSLAIAMNREFAFSSSILPIVTTQPPWNWVPGWAERTVIKKNMTSNSIVPLYKHVVALSESDQVEFSVQVAELETYPLTHAWIRNPIGSYLNQISIPNPGPYVARGFDLNAKISLFNGVLGNEITPELLAETVNPYYQQGYPAKINSDGSRACFDGPLADERYFRCLGIRQR